MDGKEVPYRKAMDTFMAFSVPKGEHTVELRFVPKGFTAGVCITAVSLAALAGYCLWRKKPLTFHFSKHIILKK